MLGWLVFLSVGLSHRLHFYHLLQIFFFLFFFFFFFCHSACFFMFPLSYLFMNSNNVSNSIVVVNFVDVLTMFLI